MRYDDEDDEEYDEDENMEEEEDQGQDFRIPPSDAAYDDEEDQDGDGEGDDDDADADADGDEHDEEDAQGDEDEEEEDGDDNEDDEEDGEDGEDGENDHDEEDGDGDEEDADADADEEGDGDGDTTVEPKDGNVGADSAANEQRSRGQSLKRSASASPIRSLSPTTRPRPPHLVRRTQIVPSYYTPPSSLSIEAIVAIPIPSPVHCLAASACSSYLLTGSQDGYVRAYDFYASVNGQQQLTAQQKVVIGMGESVSKGGVARGWWGNEVWDDDDEEEEDGEGEEEEERKRKEKEKEKGRKEGQVQANGADGAGGGDVRQTSGGNPRDRPVDQPVHRDPGRLEPVYSMVVEGDGMWALTGTQSGPINLFTLRHQPGHLVHTLKGHGGVVSSMVLTPDEKGLLSGSWDGNINQWDLNTGDIVRHYPTHGAQVSSLSLRPTALFPYASPPPRQRPANADGEDENMDGEGVGNGRNGARSADNVQVSVGEDFFIADRKRRGDEDKVEAKSGLRSRSKSKSPGMEIDGEAEDAKQDGGDKGSDGVDGSAAAGASPGRSEQQKQSAATQGDSAAAGGDVEMKSASSSKPASPKTSSIPPSKDAQTSPKPPLSESKVPTPPPEATTSTGAVGTDIKSEAKAEESARTSREASFDDLFADDGDDLDADADAGGEADAEGETVPPSELGTGANTPQPQQAAAASISASGPFGALGGFSGLALPGMPTTSAQPSLPASTVDSGTGASATPANAAATQTPASAVPSAPLLSAAGSTQPVRGAAEILPLLSPASYREFSDDVLLASFMDGQVMLIDKRVQEREWREGKGVGRLMGAGGPPWCMSACWSGDGTQILAGRRNGTIDIWDVRKSSSSSAPNLLRTLRTPPESGPISCLVAFPDGKHIASASQDNVRLWNTADYFSETPEESMRRAKSKLPAFKIIAGHHGGTVSSMVVDPTSRFLTVASGDRGWQGESTKVVLIHEVKW